MTPQSASQLAVCVGLTRDEAIRLRAPDQPQGRLVLCGTAATRPRHEELPPGWSRVRCASELPFLSHSADAVLLSARLLPDAVLLAEARRVLAPRGVIAIGPALGNHRDAAEQALIVAELEAAGLTIDVCPDQSWSDRSVVLARVPRGRGRTP